MGQSERGASEGPLFMSFPAILYSVQRYIRHYYFRPNIRYGLLVNRPFDIQPSVIETCHPADNIRPNVKKAKYNRPKVQKAEYEKAEYNFRTKINDDI